MLIESPHVQPCLLIDSKIARSRMTYRCLRISASILYDLARRFCGSDGDFTARPARRAVTQPGAIPHLDARPPGSTIMIKRQ
jgi:hypothetical protein